MVRIRTTLGDFCPEGALENLCLLARNVFLDVLVGRTREVNKRCQVGRGWLDSRSHSTQLSTQFSTQLDILVGRTTLSLNNRSTQHAAHSAQRSTYLVTASKVDSLAKKLMSSLSRM